MHTSLSTLTKALDFTDVPSAEVVEVYEPPPLEEIPLTTEEDNFALMYLETGGNIGLAYQLAFHHTPENPIHQPKANGIRLASKPNIQRRIANLSAAIEEGALITMGAHLHELAEIRDLGKARGELKVALDAEVKRGEVGGLYVRNNSAGKDKLPALAMQVNFVSRHDSNI